ncbi:type II secretion system protein [Candidatus Woesebacteria bacterium]|nr:type II secretion system protein [Candidatus Woesebacteria bacterium]
MKKIKRSSGFTLIELVLFMGLFSILLIIIANVFTALADKQLEIQEITYVESDARYILERLRYDIHRADAIINPIVLGDSDTILIISIDGTNYTYAENGGQLELTVGSSSFNLNSPTTVISLLSFQHLGNVGGRGAIRVQYTVQSTVQSRSGGEIQQVNTTISL